MNERIKCLLRRTGVDIHIVPGGCVIAMTGYEFAKFTEFFTKECAYLVNHQQRTTGYTTHAQMLCREFGVEYKDEDYYGNPDSRKTK